MSPPRESTAHLHQAEVSADDKKAIEWYAKTFEHQGLMAIHAELRKLQVEPTGPERALFIAKKQRLRLELRRRELYSTYDLARVARDFYNMQARALIVPFRWTNIGTFGAMTSSTALLYCRHMNCFEFVHWCGWLASGQPQTRLRPVEVIDPVTGKVVSASKTEWSATPRMHGDLAKSVWDGPNGTTTATRVTASAKPARNKVIIISRSVLNENSGDYHHVGISDGAGMVYHLSSGGLGRLKYTPYSAFCGYFACEYEGDYNYI